MKIMRYLILLPFLFTAGCGGSSGFSVSSQTVVTDKNITPENPVVMKRSNTIIGFLTLQNTNLKLDKIGGHYSLVGSYKLVDKDETVLSAKDYSLTGSVKSEEASNLYPAAGTEIDYEQSRARITCLENDVEGFCRQLIVDFYVRKDGHTYAAQVEIELDGAARPEEEIEESKKDEVGNSDSQSQEEADDDTEDEDHTDVEEDGGLYVGTLHEDTEPLFK